MQNLVYAHPADNVAATGTASVNTGTINSAFPVTLVNDSAPSTFAKFSTTAASIVIDLGVAKQIDLGAVIGHNLDGTVTLQGNATNVWTAPTVSIVMPALGQDADGFWKNRWVDVAATYGTGARTLRYWRVLVAANTALISIGEIWLSIKYSLVQNIDWGVVEIDESPTVVQRTDAGVRLSYSYGHRLRRFDCELVDITDANAALIRTWWLNSRGAARSFVIIPEGDEGEIMQVAFAEAPLSQTRGFLNQRSISLSFEELSRGIV